MRARRIRAMARKEWIQLRRDPRSLLLAFALPIFLLIFFGYAINWDVDELALVVLDRSVSAESRALVEAFEASGYFEVVERTDSEQVLGDRLTRGTAAAALLIPPDYAEGLGSGTASVQLLLDGSDANTATIALNYADAIVQLSGVGTRTGSGVKTRSGDRSGGSITLGVESRVWYNPTLESRHMIVPSLIAVIMSVIAALLTALTIAREWERGTMEQLASTPVGRFEVVVGKLIPYVLIGMFDVALTVVAGILLFQSPMRGSYLLLGALSLLFLVGALGFGVFISAAVKSQVLATQIAMIATYLPAVLLSGFLFDIGSMPRALQGITYLIPARYFVTVTRGIFLKGVGAEVLWSQALMMLLFAAAGLALATRAFRKELS